MTDESDEAPKKQISRPRKIIILIFIVVFWILYYWFAPTPSPDSKSGTPANSSGQSSIDYSR
jgi:hypothetical protein